MKRSLLTLLLAVLLGPGCTNNPYPDSDADQKVLYLPFSEPPKTLDPAVSYSTVEHVITGPVYESLLEYHYLDRPYRLIPGLAEQVPVPEVLPDGKVRYRFVLREGVHFGRDECFVRLGTAAAGGGRPATAKDLVFAMQRIADPANASPVIDPFSSLVGLRDFGQALEQRRKSDPRFAAWSVRRQYEALGGFEGARADDARTFTVTLAAPYPQILYWFAITFSSPVAWEAIEYYDGEDGRPLFAEHPVGTGPYRVSVYQKQARIVLEKNDLWYGVTHPEQRAPGAVFPRPTLDEDAGFRGLADLPLPFLQRIEFRMEKETIPAFSKFLQGYYDRSGITRESFDRVITEGRLSGDMASRGMSLSRSVIPAVYYIGFNMDDPVVGQRGGERARLLRQAMSLSTDVGEYLRLFTNGRGVPAETPLPPGLFGYDEKYQNPYRRLNLERARQLLAQAGLPQGIDPKTGQPLRLTFDVPDTSPEGRLRYQFWVDQWRRLGIDVHIEATNYNKFQEKVRDGAYQIFQWGWVADYPDPENFLFLLTGPMARSRSGGPNSANFQNEEYDQLFASMKVQENGPERFTTIRRMLGIIERERPWIELFHPEEYVLLHEWMRNVKPAGLSIPTVKYHSVEPELRQRRREAWNRPILWPAFALLGLIALVIAPGVWAFFKERQ